MGLAATGELTGRAEIAFDRSDPDALRLDLAVDVARCVVRGEPPRADVRRLLGAAEHRQLR